ncbi:MAG: SDR family oxidoreductase [Pseudomonadota bacterium]
MSEASSFAGRYAVITGGGQGVGEATARLFAARGASGLAICGRDPIKLDRVAKELDAKGCPTLPIQADLAHVEQCFKVVDQAAAKFGQLDCLVNAAGITDRGTIDDTSAELFDKIFAVNARAPYFLMQRVLPWLRKVEGGTIVNVTSIVANCGPPFISAYSASKGALAVMTKNVANAVLPERIRVNALNMGWTATPGENVIQQHYHNLPENWLEEADASTAMGRLLRPEDIARAIAFLASAESGLMTGAVVDFEQTVVGAIA